MLKGCRPIFSWDNELGSAKMGRDVVSFFLGRCSLAKWDENVVPKPLFWCSDDAWCSPALPMITNYTQMSISTYIYYIS